jgi:hypothetical protein
MEEKALEIARAASERALCFDGSDYVRFLPWIGEHYRCPRFGCRTLILGLSAYGTDPYDELTIDAVSGVIAGVRRDRFFTSTTGAFLKRSQQEASDGYLAS